MQQINGVDILRLHYTSLHQERTSIINAGVYLTHVKNQQSHVVTKSCLYISSIEVVIISIEINKSLEYVIDVCMMMMMMACV